MHFCSFCDNMLFIRNTKEEGDDQLNVKLYCKYCNNSEDFKSLDRQSEESDENPDIPKYISHDVTLPRRNDVKCTTDDCEGEEIILLRVDNSTKKYNFYCVTCKQTFIGQD